jgi:putative aldouronate transport system permease protein
MIQERGFFDRSVDVILHALLVLLAVACLVPFLYVISVSLSSHRAVSAHQVSLWPIGLHLFRGIPDELWEAAMLDGANHFQVLFRVFVPISTPVLATVTLFSAVGHWNSRFDALVYLKKAETWPLQTCMYGLVTSRNLVRSHWSGRAERAGEIFQQATPEGLATAMLLVAAIPIMMVYPFLQRYFVHGLTLGAVKE